MTVRLACSPADLESTRRLVVEVWRDAGLPEPPVVSAGESSLVLVVLGNDGEAVGTLTLVLHGEIAIASRFAITPRGNVSTWKVLVDEALKELSKGKVKILAATVNPAMENRWRRYLGLVTVSRGLYGELGSVPAVVMVGSVDAMRERWKKSWGS